MKLKGEEICFLFHFEKMVKLRELQFHHFLNFSNLKKITQRRFSSFFIADRVEKFDKKSEFEYGRAWACVRRLNKSVHICCLPTAHRLIPRNMPANQRFCVSVRKSLHSVVCERHFMWNCFFLWFSSHILDPTNFSNNLTFRSKHRRDGKSALQIE